MKTWDEITADRRAEQGYAERIAVEKQIALGAIRRYHLAELRRIAAFTQTELASRMGNDQSRVSRVETESDMRLSTLRAYVEALGAEMRVYAEFPGEDFLPLSI